MKILKLLKNEIIKQTHKLSFIISVIIIILMSVFISSSSKINELINPESNNVVDVENMYGKYPIEEMDKNSPAYKVIQDIMDERQKIIDEYKGIRITWADFRSNLFSQVVEYKMQRYLYQEYFNGNEDIVTYKTEIEKVVYMYVDFSDEEAARKQLEDLNAKINSMDKAIKQNDYSYIIEGKISEYVLSLKYIDEQINMLKTKYDLTKESEKKLYDKELSSLNKQKEQTELYKSLYGYILENNIKDSNDHRIRYTDKIIEYYTNYINTEIMSEEDFMSSYYNREYKTYEEYVSRQERYKKIYKNEVNKLEYAIKKNIEFDKDGARSELNNITSSIQIIGIFIIIIAGGIVSNEFSKGTIRLLLTKSSKRWKILLSKLLSVIIFALIFMLIYLSLAFLTTSLLYGVKDYSIPMLEVINGNVVEVNFILYILKISLIYMVPLVFSGILAFGLSTVINNTAFAVGSSIFLMLSSELFIYILVLFSKKLAAITFLPYMNMGYFLNPNMITELESLLGMNVTMPLAFGILGIYTLIFIVVSFIVFVKKDIKN